jgi:peptidylprolyl isomerase
MSRVRVLAITVLLGFAAGCSGGTAPARDSIPAPPDVAVPSPDALKTTSGLFIKVLQEGRGTRHPRSTDRVTVHYTGWTTDGKMFDSSVTRAEPATFALNGVIPGWTEGVQRMVEGEKVRLWIPERLAYDGAPGQPAGMLVFDIELLKIGN